MRAPVHSTSGAAACSSGSRWIPSRRPQISLRRIWTVCSSPVPPCSSGRTACWTAAQHRVG